MTEPSQSYPSQSYPSQSYPSQSYPQYTPPPPPPTNAGWAAAAVIFFWPLAFSAFTHSSNVYPRWAMGDFQGAQYASDRAKKLGQIALWIWVGFMVLFIGFYVVLFAALASSSNNW